MGALDNLLAGKPAGNASTAAAKPVLAPKVQSAKGALATQTAKVKANFVAQNAKKKTGNLDRLLQTTQRVAEGGDEDNGFDFSWNPIKLVGEVAQNVPAVGAALEVADTPRAMITSAIKEAIVDPITGQGGPSLGDYLEQIKFGKHVGFGQLEEQANPNQNDWVKRIIGFAGDVAADPLTYIGAGVVGKGGTLAKGLATADRVELAKALATKAAEGAEGVTDEVIANVGRKGLPGLAPELRETLGMKPALTAGGVAIPGTEGLAMGVRKATGKLREVAGDTVLGKAARRIGTAPSEAKLTEAVVKGGEHAAESARALESVAQMKGVARQFGAIHGKDLTNILKGMSKEELRALPRQLESGVTTGAAGRARVWLDNLLVEANKRGANLARIEDYYPHALTPDAAEAMAREGVLKTRAPGMMAAPELLRKYKANDEFMGRTLENGSAEEINTIAKEKLGYDLFSTKAEEVLPHYLQAIQSSVARGTYANRLVEHGVAKPIGAKERFTPTETPVAAATSIPMSDANVAAQFDMAGHVGNYEALAASIDSTARAADVVRPRAGGYAELAGQKIEQAKELIATHANSPDPQIRANAVLEAGARNAEARVGLMGDDLTFADMERFLHSKEAPVIMSEQIDKGFRKISSQVQAPEWLAEARLVERALTPQGWKQFIAAYDRFTQMWKAAATFSPGFHVRNAYSGVFNNFVAGVAPGSYRVYHSLRNRAESGTLKGADAELWNKVHQAVEATGNPFDPAEIGRAGSRPAHGKVLSAPGRASRWAGNQVEDHLRGAMALDSLKRGEDLVTAIDRVNRFHFNYADISNFDRSAKRIIPFWMFTSRNLPLQIQMILRRPGAYTKYLSLQRNLELGTTPDEIVPSYFGEQGAMRTDILQGDVPGFGEGTKYLALDLPFLRVNKDLEQLAEPIRLLSNANPLIKVPIEGIAGRRLYNDVPFRDELGEVPAYMNLPGVKQALAAVGAVDIDASGNAVATDRQLSAIESLLPLAGRARRLLPSEDSYEERRGTSLASFLGLTSLTNTPSAQAGELARRKRALEEFVKTQQQLGFYPKAKSNAPKPRPFGKN